MLLIFSLDVCLELADRFVRFNPEAVVGPVTGGAILAQNVARILSLACHNQQDEVLALYAEKVGETFALRRGYDELVVGKRVLVVEDVLRTGGSVRKVADAVRAAGGSVIGVGALFNRGGVTAQDLGGLFRLECLFDLILDSWPAKDCPLCKEQMPLNTAIGHGGK